MCRQDDINVTDGSFFSNGDPHAIFTRWRNEDPVRWTEGRLSRGFWSVTSHQEMMRVFAYDRKAFSVQQFGACLPQSPDMEDEETSVFIRLMRSGAQLSVMDGEPHSILRKVFQERFGADGIGTLDDLIRSCTEQIMSDVLPRGECDFTVEVGGRLPLAVISAMLDIPAEDWGKMYRWANMIGSPDDPEWTLGAALETTTVGTASLVEYCARLGLQRRSGNATDLLSMLARATIDGQLLTEEQIGFNGLMFFAAGHETTRAALSAGLLELMRDPVQMRWLVEHRREPDVLAVAAEECVRWASPLTHVLRTAITDFELGGKQIKKGDWVVGWLVSANRDEAVFRDPFRFDVQRTPNRHLGFAVGKHHCLGAHLARAEMRIMLEYILEHMAQIELVGNTPMSASNLFWGIKHMPVKFPRRAGVQSLRDHHAVAG